MDLDVTPEPTVGERDAIAAALDEIPEPDTANAAAAYDSPWRLAGLRENAADD